MKRACKSLCAQEDQLADGEFHRMPLKIKNLMK